jgi:hypothetical protein
MTLADELHYFRHENFSFAAIEIGSDRDFRNTKVELIFS